MKLYKNKYLVVLISLLLALTFLSGCKDDESNLSDSEMKILNTNYTKLSQDQKDNIPLIVKHMNLHDWNKYGDKLKKLYEDENISDLGKAGSTHPDEDKKVGDEEYEEDKKEAIAKLKGKPIKRKKVANDSTNTSNTTTPPANQRIVKGKATDLGAGTFTGGSDIQEGLYDATPIDGSGNFTVKSSNGELNINEIIGNDEDGTNVKKVRILISQGDQVQLQGINKTHFEPVTSQFVTSKQQQTLYSGYWIVGQDIAVGKYVAGNNQSKGGSNFFVYRNNAPIINEIVGGDQGVQNVTIDLQEGDIIRIGNSNGITLTPQ